MNQQYVTALGKSDPTLPLKSSGNIKVTNSLHEDWEAFCPRANRADDEVYIIGNPPFGGWSNRTDEQRTDMDIAFSGFDKYQFMDYVAAWFWKGAQYIKNSRARLALVATNSISQGEPVAMLWPYILALNCYIAFAWQSFPWGNSAKNKATVHVVIIGLAATPIAERTPPDKIPLPFTSPRVELSSNTPPLSFTHARNSPPRRLYIRTGDEWHCQYVSNISPYLIAGSNLVVSSRKKPLAEVSEITVGSCPKDGGHLLLSAAEKEKMITHDPRIQKWIRKIVGSDEYLNGKERWCLWFLGEELAFLKTIPIIREKLSSVEKMRLASKKKATRKLAQTPHLFGEIRHPVKGHYIIAPIVSSERREYIPFDLKSADIVATNLAQIVLNGTLYELGIMQSAIHHDWMRTVSSRLENRYRYSGTLVYNTFPWPLVDDTQRAMIAGLAEEILLIREDYPDKNLAELYDPDKMPQPLRDAHCALDAAVDELYRPGKPFADSSERLEHLFALYAQYIAGEQISRK